MNIDQYSPDQVGAPCRAHPFHTASPKSRKMSRSYLRSWNGENRVVQHLPARIVNSRAICSQVKTQRSNAVGVNLHRIHNLPRRERQAEPTVCINRLNYSEKKPDAKCKRVRLHEYRRKQRRYCRGNTLEGGEGSNIVQLKYLC